MAKTQEELNALKDEVKTLNNKLKELTEDELKQVSGGTIPITVMLETVIGGTQPFIGSAFSQNADKADKEKTIPNNMGKAA